MSQLQLTIWIKTFYKSTMNSPKEKEFMFSLNHHKVPNSELQVNYHIL